MLKYANPTLFSGLVARLLPWLSGATALAFALGLWGAFFASPADYQQGDTVRIMYIHVPAAWLSMFCYATMTASALGTLVWRHPLADAAQKAAAPLGASFTFICLVTGSLWGKPMWGTWWVWDARLTSVLVLFVIYLGLIALWQTIEEPARGQPADHQILGRLVEHAPPAGLGVPARRPDHRRLDAVAAADHGRRLHAAVHDAAPDVDAQRDPAPAPASPCHPGGKRWRGGPARPSPDRAGGRALINHLGFIATSYALAFAVIAGMIGAIVLEYRRLRRELSRFEDHDA